MQKIIVTVTLVLLTLLCVGGVFFPHNPFMWLTSTSEEFTIARIALIMALVVLLTTTPPRNIVFRSSLFAFSGVLTIATIVLIDSYQIGLFDALIMSQVAIIMAIEAMEYSVKPATSERYTELG